VLGILLELVGTVSEQWRRIAPRGTTTGRMWVHALPPMKATNSGSETSSSPLPFLASGEELHHLQQQKKHTQQSIVVSFLDLVSSAFLHGCCGCY